MPVSPGRAEGWDEEIVIPDDDQEVHNDTSGGGAASGGGAPLSYLRGVGVSAVLDGSGKFLRWTAPKINF